MTTRGPNILFVGEDSVLLRSRARTEVKGGELLEMECPRSRGIHSIRNKILVFASGASGNTANVVIMYDVDFLTHEAQSALRRGLENCARSTRFIFTSTRPNLLMEPIRSRVVIKTVRNTKRSSHSPHSRLVGMTASLPSKSSDLMNRAQEIANAGHTALDVFARCIENNAGVDPLDAVQLERLATSIRSEVVSIYTILGHFRSLAPSFEKNE